MMIGNYITANNRARDSTTSVTQLACPISELRDLVTKYTDDAVKDLYTEAASRLAETNKKGSFVLPARMEKRKSLGLDRSSIPEAQIGWLVHFYWKNVLIATGIVRQFLQRERNCDLVIVRLLSELDVEALVKQIDRSTTSTIELKVNCEDPRLLKRCRRLFFLTLRLKGLKLSPVAMEYLFGDPDRAQATIVWPAPLNSDVETPLPKKLSFKLNEEQDYCLRRAISRRATVIDGVVGSGKTHLAACIAYCLAYERNLKVLICSPHAGTVDLISKLLIDNKIFIDDDEHQLSVVRVTNERKVFRKSQNKNLLALRQLKQPKVINRPQKSGKLSDMVECFVRDKSRQRLEKLQDCYPEIKTKMTHMIEKCVRLASRKTIKEAEDKILKRANIVCCTIDEANRSTVYKHKYDVLIVDDAHLVADPDLTGPLMQPYLKQVVMLGESLFLPNKSESDDDEAKRLFYQICGSTEYCGRLNEHYRAHRSLMDFADRHFYNNKLELHWRCNDRIELTLRLGRYICWMPQVGSMMSVFATSSPKLIAPTIEKIIKQLITVEDVPRSAIMVITTDKYHINDRDINGVKIRTVPEAVGLECDFVILSCDQWSHRPQRLSYELNSNFILNERAFHIALNRARLGIFIVAQQSLLDVSLRKGLLNNLSREIGHIDQEIDPAHNCCMGWQKLVHHHDRSGTIFNSHRLD